MLIFPNENDRIQALQHGTRADDANVTLKQRGSSLKHRGGFDVSLHRQHNLKKKSPAYKLNILRMCMGLLSFMIKKGKLNYKVLLNLALHVHSIPPSFDLRQNRWKIKTTPLSLGVQGC